MSGPLAVLDAGDDWPRAVPPFDDVYASHAANVHRFCLSQLGDADAAADVTHDAFIKAFSAYERVAPDPQTTRTWLISIARNCCIDYRRQNSRWQRLIARLERFGERPLDVEELAHHHSELERATAAIVQLRTRERELIGLRVAADLSFRDGVRREWDDDDLAIRPSNRPEDRVVQFERRDGNRPIRRHRFAGRSAHSGG